VKQQAPFAETDMAEAAESVAQDDAPHDEAGNADPRTIQADAKLVARCSVGEVAAWEELYAQCHEPLCSSIRGLLGPLSDPNLVDEIAARVWYALVANDGALLARYSPGRGARLITYMRALAKDEICRHFRSELRRRERELVALRNKSPQHGIDLAQSVHAMEEFLATLTPHERGFCQDFLLTEPADSPDRFSPSSIWQLTHRIYQKLLRFVDKGD
jgi:DNA-directed RNA polymerase specialized sigma24 family protein